MSGDKTTELVVKKVDKRIEVLAEMGSSVDTISSDNVEIMDVALPGCVT